MIGLLGKPDLLNLEALEKICKEMSSKEVKVQQRKEVKFQTKTKGAKPIVTKDIVLVSITGENFNLNTLSQVLADSNGQLLD